MGLVGEVPLALTELDQRLPTSLIIFTGAATVHYCFYGGYGALRLRL